MKLPRKSGKCFAKIESKYANANRNACIAEICYFSG